MLRLFAPISHEPVRRILSPPAIVRAFHPVDIPLAIVGTAIVAAAMLTPAQAFADDAQNASQPTERQHTDSTENDPTNDDADTDGSVEPPASGDEQSTDTNRFSLEHRRELYRQSRLSPWAAAGWTMLLPGLGNLYAEQYLLAGLGFVSVTFSGSFLAYGYAVDNLALRVLGFGFAGIAYGGGLGTSIPGVHRYNRQRRQSLGLDDQRAHFRFGPDGPRHLRHTTALSEPLMLNLRFSF